MAAGVLVNQAHLLLAAARYGEACDAARESVRLAELCSPTGRLVVALYNLGEALTRVGEYDEAKWQLQRAVALSRRLGPGRCAMGLLGIAEVHRHLGHDEQGRSAYLEALGLARVRTSSRCSSLRWRASPGWRPRPRPMTPALPRRRPSGSPRRP